MAVILSLGGVGSGCGDDCEDLQDICDQCQNPDQRFSCESAVDTGDATICARNIDGFEDICP